MIKSRIAGPPGTGKTTKLVEIYYNHLVENYSPTNIPIQQQIILEEKYMLMKVLMIFKKKQDMRFFTELNNQKHL